MSIARGLLTGFLGGAIADKEAKDKAHLEVVKNVRTNYFNNTFSIKSPYDYQINLDDNSNLSSSMYDQSIFNSERDLNHAFFVMGEKKK